MRVDPALRAVDDEANAAYIRDVVTALTARDNTTVGVVDAALEASPARARRMLELLKAMHLGLLERYLKGH